MSRSIVIILILLGLPFVLRFQEPAKVQISEAPLDAQDIGIYKYSFEASPPADSVMVFRWTQSNGEHVFAVDESISYTAGKSAREVIIICDPSRFPFRDLQDARPISVTYKALRAAGELTHMHLDAVSVGSRRATFRFTGENDRTKTFLFECFVESYATAKARCPALPEATLESSPSGWKFYPH